MEKQSIISKMNEFLHIATSQLASWLSNKLCRISDNWWRDCVMDKLSYNRNQVKKLGDELNRAKKEIEALKTQKNNLLRLNNEELAGLKEDKKKFEELKKTLKKFL